VIHDTLNSLGLTSGMAARLLGVSERNLRRWRHADPDDAPDGVRQVLAMLTDTPGALRDDYHPDARDAGPRDAPETVRRLRWLQRRFARQLSKA
jgi:hypothetical protein